MTAIIEYAPSNAELAVAQRFTILNNLPADNKYQNLISSLIPRWFLAAPPHLRAALRASMHKGHQTQQYVANVLAQITPMEKFAEPLLSRALAVYGWLDVTPKAFGIKEVHLISNVLVFIANQQLELVDSLAHAVLPEALIPQSLELNLVSSITQFSLLQAAMLNFEANQALDGGFASGSAVFEVTGGEKVARPQLAPEKFAQITRNLNLGLQYQWHLDNVFRPQERQWAADDPRSRAWEIKHNFSSNLRHEFESALHIAYMKGEINAYHYSLIVNTVLAPGPGPASLANLHSTFEILEFEVTGVILIWPERKPADQPQSCVVYLPQGPFRSFYEFGSLEAFKIQLRQWLRSEQFAAYFVQRVPVRHRAEFMRRTDIRHVTWDSLLLLRPPIINEPALLSLSRHKPQTGDPFEVAWQLQLAQIKDDSRMLMVPTEDEDTKSRLARQAMYLNLGLSLMGLALGFVPVLGEILLASSVIQMGGEVYEGLGAWQHGDRVAALEHLFDITENIALAASTAGGARLLQPRPVVDALIPVTKVSGSKRLWKPDLSGYELKGVTLSGLTPDARGVYTVRGQQAIFLEGKVYRIETSEHSALVRIQHPKDPDAHSPQLFYNGHGVWIHELENPMSWSRSQLLHRLGVEAQGLSDTALEQCLTLSNTTEAELRKMYVEHLKMPPLLLDSLRRMRLIEGIDGAVARMKLGHWGGKELAEIELQMLTRLPGWPAGKVLRIVDNEGVILRELGNDLSENNPRMQIAQAQILKGDLLKVTLECLSTAEIDQLLGEQVPGIEQQAQNLAKTVAVEAERHKQELFTGLYNASEQYTAEMNVFKEQFASLPSHVIEELLTHLTPEQRLELNLSRRLPLPALEEARSYLQAVRLNRVVEGIYHPFLSTADSQTVALQMLTAMQGWPANMRLVLRDGVMGEVLQQVGNTAAAYTREIIKTGDYYEFHGTSRPVGQRSRQVLDKVLDALSGLERTAMGLNGAQPQRDFRVKIGNLAAAQRHEVARILGMHKIKPWYKSPLRLADGRVGYTLGGRVGHLAPEGQQSLKSMVQNLYPAMSDVQAGQFLYRLRSTPNSLTRVLVNLRAELDTLRHDLQRWEASEVRSELRNGGRMLVTSETKKAISRALIRAWRRQTSALHIDSRTGYELDLDSWPADILPTLTADFSHITSLNLVNSSNGNFPADFLVKFPRLQVLNLKNCQLRQLPGALANMPDLVHLNLRGNRIELNDHSLAILTGLRKLKYLSLMGNRLNRRISVRNMPALEHLDLRYTGISEWPEGIESVVGLIALDLRDNAIQVIPPQILTAQRISTNRVTALHDNPLDADSLRRLELYSREHGVNLGIGNLRQHTVSREGILSWAVLPSYAQRSIWTALEREEGSADFFRVLKDLRASSQYLHQHENLTQRVWSLISAMHKHAQLRSRVFEMASNPQTCSDGIAMIFADIELYHLVFTAHSEANTAGSLLSLARGLFRIELLNKHVLSVVEARVAAIRGRQAEYVARLQQLIDEVDPDFVSRPLAELDPVEQQGVAYRMGTSEALELAERISPVAVQRQIARLDPLEIQMFYQVKLAEELGLPARPQSMRFERIAEVTREDLAAAKQHVLHKDTAEAFSSSVAQMGFWKDYLHDKYAEQFRASDSAQDDSMDVLFAARESMPSHEYVLQSDALAKWRERTRASLFGRLTWQEITDNPQVRQPQHQQRRDA